MDQDYADILKLNDQIAMYYTGDFGAQLNVIFVAMKLLQFKIARVNQLRFQCDFSAIYRRGLRCNSRNTMTLSSSFTLE